MAGDGGSPALGDGGGQLRFRYTFASDILDVMSTPLREPTFLILTALAHGPLHGYAIITEVTDLSESRVTLRPGTLYGALDRLGDDGLVTADREEVVDGRLRRYYRLTDEGAKVLRAETERMRRNVEAAARRLRARDRAARAVAGGASTPATSPVGGVA
jgi:DNA-binding PadR family transcriptional regulator